LQLIANDIADWKARGQVIAVFHTNAGHVTLHDEAYNAERTVATGNPYKQLLVELMKHGVGLTHESRCRTHQRSETSGASTPLHRRGGRARSTRPSTTSAPAGPHSPRSSGREATWIVSPRNA
jgi:hypothetical protein